MLLTCMRLKMHLYLWLSFIIVASISIFCLHGLHSNLFPMIKNLLMITFCATWMKRASDHWMVFLNLILLHGSCLQVAELLTRFFGSFLTDRASSQRWGQSRFGPKVSSVVVYHISRYYLYRSWSLFKRAWFLRRYYLGHIGCKDLPTLSKRDSSRPPTEALLGILHMARIFEFNLFYLMLFKGMASSSLSEGQWEYITCRHSIFARIGLGSSCSDFRSISPDARHYTSLSRTKFHVQCN